MTNPRVEAARTLNAVAGLNVLSGGVVPGYGIFVRRLSSVDRGLLTCPLTSGRVEAAGRRAIGGLGTTPVSPCSG